MTVTDANAEWAPTVPFEEQPTQPEGMLIQVWCPDATTGIEMLKEIRELGFVSVPELAEWYHRNGCIMDISPAPVREQEDVWPD